MCSRLKNYGRNPDPSNASGNGARPFPDRRRGVRSCISLMGGPHSGRLEVWPDVGAPMAANLAGKLGLKVRQAHMIRPAYKVDHDRVRAFVIAAIDQKPGRAGFPHFAEGDFLLPHALLKRGRDASGKPLQFGGRCCCPSKAPRRQRKAARTSGGFSIEVVHLP